MGKASDELNKRGKFIYEHFQQGNFDSGYLSGKRFDQLNHTEIGLLTGSVLMAAAESSMELRPFWPACNPDFGSFALQTAQEMWKKEEDLDLPIKGSPTAALCFAIIAGSVQHNAIGTSLIGGFTLKLHNSRELYQEIAGKNSDKVFFDITNRRPMSKKTTDTTNDRTGWSQIAWRGSMSKKTTDNTNDSLRLIRELAKEMVEYQKIFVTKEYLTDIINETKINVYPTGKALLAIRVAGLSVNLFYAGMAWSDKKTAMVLTIFIGDYLQENSILLRKDFMDQFAFYLERLKSAKDQDRGLWDVASETYALLDQEQGIEYEDKTALLNFVKAVTYIFKLGLRNNHEMIDDVGLKCGIMAKKTAESMPEDRSSAEEL